MGRPQLYFDTIDIISAESRIQIRDPGSGFLRIESRSESLEESELKNQLIFDAQPQLAIKQKANKIELI